jgi:SHAQKYF class myb-like DNA-binding protein
MTMGNSSGNHLDPSIADPNIFFSGEIDNDDEEIDFLGDPNMFEKTGRWTREEHHLFLKGLEMYGRGWKKIAMLMKTRTVVQIRTHAQKYFLKLQKAHQGGEGNGMLMAAKSLFGRKRRKRRPTDKPISLATQLRPFFGFTNQNTDEILDKDIDDHLYNFLSPVLPPTVGVGLGLETAAESNGVAAEVIAPRQPEW